MVISGEKASQILAGADQANTLFFKSSVRPATVNLTIGNIYRSNNKKLDHVPTTHHLQSPGEVILVEVKEEISIPEGYCGLLFIPNTLAKKGMLITNPGHIDPGFTGIVTLCLVNMSSRKHEVSISNEIARLMLFKIEEPEKNPRQINGRGVDSRQLEAIGHDFADISKRTKKTVLSVFFKHSVLFLTVIVTALAIFAISVPFILKPSDVNTDNTQLLLEIQDERISKLEAELSQLQKNDK